MRQNDFQAGWCRVGWPNGDSGVFWLEHRNLQFSGEWILAGQTREEAQSLLTCAFRMRLAELERWSLGRVDGPQADERIPA